MDGGRSLSAAGVVVFDSSGSIFNLLRSLDLGVPLWRITDAVDLEHAEVSVAVVASYGQMDWDLVNDFAGRMAAVIVTTDPRHEDACHAVATGALGYVDVSLSPDAVRRAILGVINGEHAYSRRVLSTVIRSGRWLRAANSLTLTPRQREVVTLIAKGAADKEIAQTLGITTATAQKHVTNLLRRLNVPNRAAAVAVTAAVYPVETRPKPRRSIDAFGVFAASATGKLQPLDPPAA